jgi:RNA polymerase sigma-70 factor (ECF subfamily)
MTRFLGPGHEIDDAVQDALIELASALERFRGESSVRTYAYRIALRVAYQHRRKRPPVLPPLALVCDEADPEVLLSQRQALIRLYAALDALTSQQREAVLLCAIEKMPHPEAAEVLGVEVEALRQRLKRGRRELRERLAHDPLLGGFFADGSADSRADET